MSNLIKVSQVNVEAASVMYSAPKKEKSEATVKVVNSPSPGEIISEAKLAARAIIESAEAEAEEIRRRVKEEAATLLAEARMNGYKEGLEQGRVKAQLEAKQLLDEIKALMERLDGDKESLLAQTKTDTIDLAFTIAEKVLEQRLVADRKMFLKLYEKAVKDINAENWVKISVSKQEIEFVTRHSEYLLSMVKGAERLEIEVLEDAPPGTCIVETSEKIVDTGIHTQIGMLRDAVFTA